MVSIWMLPQELYRNERRITKDIAPAAQVANGARTGANRATTVSVMALAGQ
jgi:hypothetical protein